MFVATARRVVRWWLSRFGRPDDGISRAAVVALAVAGGLAAFGAAGLPAVAGQAGVDEPAAHASATPGATAVTTPPAPSPTPTPSVSPATGAAPPAPTPTPTVSPEDSQALKAVEEHAGALTKAFRVSTVPKTVLGSRTSLRSRPGPDVLVESLAPRYVRRDGKWIGVDTGLLRRPDGRWEPKATDVGLELPAAADGEATLGALGIGVSLGDVHAAQGRATDAGVTYPNVLADTDALLSSRANGLEVTWVLRTPESPLELPLQLRLGAGQSLVADGGAYKLLSSGGDTVGTVHAPVAWDARQRMVAVKAERVADGLMLVVEPAADARYPIVVDPVIDLAGALPEGTTTRIGHVDGYDDAGTPVIDTGGQGCYFGGVEPPFGWSMSGASILIDRWCYNNASGADYLQVEFESPGASFVSRVDTGGFQPATLGGCGYLGIRSSAASPGDEGNYGAVGADPMSARTTTRLGTCDVAAPAQSVCVNSSCSRAGTPGNVVYFGTDFRYGPSGDTTVGTSTLEDVELYRDDADAPSATLIDPPALTWKKTGTTTATAKATDSGLGAKFMYVVSPPGTLARVTEQSSCTGTLSDPCAAIWNTETFQRTFTVDTATLPEGVARLSVDAEDVVGNMAESPLPYWTVGVDRSAPVITFPNGPVITGQPMGGTAQKTLQIAVADGTPGGTEAQRRSGVATVTVSVSKLDGSGYQQEAQYTPAPGCGVDSCGVSAQFAIDATKYGPGQHTARVVATDQLGNSSTNQFSFEIDTTGPAITLSGSLYDARNTTLTKDEYRLQADVVDGVWPIRGAGTTDVQLFVTEQIGGVPIDRLLESDIRPCKDVSCDRTLVATIDTTTLAPGPVTFRLHASDALLHGSDATFSASVGAVTFSQTRWSGLEEWLAYDEVDTGGGSSAYANLVSGNLVWQHTPLVNPGRGLSTFAQVTYNSQSGGGYTELSPGWSLTISGLTRVNEPLDLSTVGAGTVRLIDGDGTQHPFTLSPDGTHYIAPPGVQLHLRRFSSAQLKAWAITRADGVTFYFDNRGYQTFVEDRNGNALRYAYEIVPIAPGTSCPMWPSAAMDTLNPAQCRQRLISVTDAEGLAPSNAPNRAVVLDYASATGPVTGLTDHAGRVTQFSYDGSTGHLVTMTEALGTSAERAFGFGYEVTGSVRSLKWVSDPRGHQTQFTYLDGYGSMTAGDLVIDPLSARRVFQITNRRGQTRLHLYGVEGTGNQARWSAQMYDARLKPYEYRMDRRGRPVKRLDPLGTTTAMTYDADNNLVRLVQAEGTIDEATTRMTYNANGLLVEQRNPLGERSVLRYRDGDGYSPGATYADSAHGYVSDLLRIETPKGSDTGDPNDFATRFEVDARGNVTASTDGAGGRAEVAYLSWGLVDYEKDPVGNFTSYHQYDASGLPREVWDAKNGHWQYAYDAVGNVTAVADPRSAAFGGLTDPQKRYRTTLTYDAQDRLVEEELPTRSVAGDFSTRTYGYDPNGNLEQVTDATGETSHTDFDEMDSVLETESAPAPHAGEPAPATEVTRFTYDAEQNVVTETRPKGVDTAQADDYSVEHTYDDINRPIVDRRRSRTSSTSQDLLTSYAYDRRDNLVGQSDPRANATWPSDPAANAKTLARQRWAFTYDRADRPKAKVQDPGGLALTTRTDYDANGNVTRVRDPRNQGLEFGPADPLTPNVAYETLYTYDGADRSLSMTRDGSTTESVRRADGRVTEVRHPRYFTAEKQSPDDFVTRYTYDAAGDLIAMAEPRIASSADAYASKLRTVQLTRDAVGNATTVTDARGHAFTNTYLDTGDLLTTTRPSMWRFQAGPGGGGELTLKDLTELGNDAEEPGSGDGGQGEGDFGTVSPQQLPSILPEAGDTQLAYDDELRLTSVTELESPLVGGAHATRVISRDPLGRIGSITTPYQREQGGAKATIVLTRGYDRNGNVVTRADGEGNTTTIAYDQFDRVAGETAPPSSTVPGAPGDVTQYAYDENSNLTSVQEPNGAAWTTRSCFDKADRLVASIDEELAVTRYRLDNAGQVVRRRSPRGTATAPSSPSCASYPMLDGAKTDWDTDSRYDPNGWLTQVTDPLGQTSTYTYDRAGNQTQALAPGAKTASGQPAIPRVSDRTYDGRDLPWATSSGTTTSPNKKITTVSEYDGNRNLRRTVDMTGLVSGLPRYADAAPETSSYASSTDRASTAIAQASWRAQLNEYSDDDQLVAMHLPWDEADPEISAGGPDTRWRQDFERDARGYVTAVRQANEWLKGQPLCAAAPAAPAADNCVKRTTYSRFDNGWIRTATGPDAQNLTSAVYGERQIYDYDRRGLQTQWQTKTNRSATDDTDTGASRSSTRQYFPSGQLRLRSNAATATGSVARQWTYGYDANGRPTSLSDSGDTAPTTDDTSYAFGYDRTGRPTSHIQNGAGNQDTLTTYDAAGNRLTQRTGGQITNVSTGAYSGGKTAASVWDHLDRESLTTVTPAGGGPIQRWQRNFHPSGEPESTVETQEAVPGSPVVRLVESKYFRDDGQPLSDNRVDANNVSVMEAGPQAYSYDDNGNLTADENGTYAYNARRQLTAWTHLRFKSDGTLDTVSDTTTYAVDGNGDLRSERDSAAGGAPNVPTTTYNYLGDRLQSTTAGPGSLKPPTTYTYDGLSGANPASIQDGASKRTTYLYDAYNRVTKSTPQSFNTSTSAWEAAGAATGSAYDSFDRRSQQKTPPDTPTTTTDFSYVGATEQLSEQKVDSSTRSFDYSGDGEPLGMSRSAGYLSFGINANGSIGTLENATGSSAPSSGKLNRYRYDPYGAARTSLSTSGIPTGTDLENELTDEAKANPLRFQGFIYDAALKTYDMRARAYRPELGRFQTADRLEDAQADFALEADPLTQSRYAWAGANPITNIEYDGHNIFDDVKDFGEDAVENKVQEAKDFYSGGADAVEETYDAVTHPERTAKGTINAVKHPVETVKTVAKSCEGRSAANCRGYVTANVLGGKGTVGAAKSGVKAGVKTGAKEGAKAGAKDVKKPEVSNPPEQAPKAPERSSPSSSRSGCTPNSFRGDTPVILGDGHAVPISSVHAGDVVRATDPLTGETSTQVVERQIVGQGIKSMVRVTVGGTVVHATAGHPFWVVGTHAWTDAKDLEVGDVLRTSNGLTARVDAIEPYVWAGQVFNLTVQTVHTYYAGALAVLVHNANCTKTGDGDGEEGPDSWPENPEPAKMKPDPNYMSPEAWAGKEAGVALRRYQNQATETGQHGKARKLAARDLDHRARDKGLLPEVQQALRARAKKLRAQAHGTDHSM